MHRPNDGQTRQRAPPSRRWRDAMTDPLPGRQRNPRVYVAGGETLLGPALRTAAARRGYHVVEVTEGGPDLGDAHAVDDFFARERPEMVIVAGGRSAGIGGNERFPA